MTLITDTSALAAFCERLQRGADAIAVDTEFMRERTYWPKLCLIQVAGDSEAAAVDPLANGIDLTPLYALLTMPRIVKVFHAARQDLEILYRLVGRLPEPVFDTQLAAMVCGFGDQVAYEALAARLAKAKLDKSSRFTDWSLRPLSQRQIDYALGDVVPLLTIYRKLRAELDSNGRAGWLDEEIASLTDPVSYEVDPESAFRRIKHRGGDGRFLAVLRELAAWREREAQMRDLPRGWVLRDEAMLEIAHHLPKTIDELARTRGLSRRLVDGALGSEILAAVARGLALPADERPLREEKREIPKNVGPIADLLKVVLKLKCEDADVAQRLVASAEDIEMIAALGCDADVPALHGWRRQVFGADALKVRGGTLALVVRGRRLTLLPAAAIPSATLDDASD
jgi:ribonuclease D